MAKPRIAIVGAGLGGLTLAIALRQRGFAPMVYERTAQLGEIGAGITLWPNANRVLYSLGLRDELERICEIPPAQSMWHYHTGEIFRVYERGEPFRAKYGGAPLYQIHRRDLHDMLVAALCRYDSSSIHLNNEVTGIESGNEKATLIARDGQRADFDLVVACDGIRSTIRAGLFGREPARFTGIVAWRALVPIERVAKRLAENPAGMHIGPARNVSHYTVRHGALLNYLVFAKVDAWEEEGWTIRANTEQVLKAVSDFQSDIINLVKATPKDTLFKWGLFDRDPCPRWSKGRVTLLGDAAHPMLPFLGQGAGMVIEDALVLARAVAESDDILTALRRYEAARHERTELTMLRSREHAEYWSTDPDEIRRKEPTMEVDLNAYDAVTTSI